jgi:hypothetical protein
VGDVDQERKSNHLEKRKSNAPMKDVHLLYLLTEEAEAGPNIRRKKELLLLKNCNTTDSHCHVQVVFR